MSSATEGMRRRARTAAGLVLDRVDDWRHRGDQPDSVLIGETAPAAPGPIDRASAPFDRDAVLRTFGRTAEIEGRSYPHVLLPGTGDSLLIHYSAFFGEWGDRRENRAVFAGWFHRLRMFWPLAEHNVLFLCDTFGADANGTYYKGVNGDFFVERAMDEIQASVIGRLGADPARIVTAGSSMGATAALRFALRHGYAGAIAVSPHIDLDISALRQGRLRHVAAIVGREDVEAPDLRPVMREVATLAQTVRPLPRLVLQSTQDDDGVHAEQVLPLRAAWQDGGGRVRSDFHPHGGHTSDYATLEFFTDSVRWCLADSTHPTDPEAGPR